MSLWRRVRSTLNLQLYAVEGVSMRPNFEPGDILLVRRGAYESRPPRRGDVVIAHDSSDSGRSYLKRIVGLPGEEVSLSEGMLYVDGSHLAEPYLEGLPACIGLESISWRLGAGEFFIMGDNRAHSADSRSFGPLAQNHIAGKVQLRLWPLNRLGRVL